MINNGPVTKSLEELLTEVFAGEYNDFQQYLIENKMTVLNVNGKVIDCPLSHLGKALQATPVTKVMLQSNKISAENAKDFALNLQGSFVNHVDLSCNKIGNDVKDVLEAFQNNPQISTLSFRRNRIEAAGIEKLTNAFIGTHINKISFNQNPIKPKGVEYLGEALQGTLVTSANLCWTQHRREGADALAKKIPGTNLLYLKLNVQERYPVLKNAVEINKRNILVSPYYLSLLPLFPKKEKEKYFNLGADMHGTLQYGAGIVMCDQLLEDVREYIFSFLPLMITKKGQNQACKYLALGKENHANDLVIADDEDNDQINPRVNQY